MALKLVADESLPWNYKVQKLFEYLHDERGNSELAESHLEACDAIWEK